MAKKNEYFLPRADRSSPQVRRSYYTFSKEYPKERLHVETKRRKKRHAKKAAVSLFFIVCFVFLSCAAFFATDFALRISNKQPQEDENARALAVATDLENLKAMHASAFVLSGKRETKACIRTLKKNDCNGVIIDFKTKDGSLAYTSAQIPAIQAHCNLFDNETVRAALALFRRAKIQVYAQVNCFNDEKIAAFFNDLAVKYLDTDVLWLDTLEENGGKPWLNPYSAQVRTYLKAVIGEISALGVNGIVLRNLSFPVGDATDTAFFDGETDSVGRNMLLKNLIHAIKKDMDADRALLLAVDADDVSGNETRYGGSIFPNESDSTVCTVTQLLHAAQVNADDDFSAAITQLHAMIGQTGAGVFIPEISESFASGALLRALNRNGYSAIVLGE